MSWDLSVSAPRLTALQTIVRRNLSALESAVISVGTVQGGSPLGLNMMLASVTRGQELRRACSCGSRTSRGFPMHTASNGCLFYPPASAFATVGNHCRLCRLLLFKTVRLPPRDGDQTGRIKKGECSGSCGNVNAGGKRYRSRLADGSPKEWDRGPVPEALRPSDKAKGSSHHPGANGVAPPYSHELVPTFSTGVLIVIQVVHDRLDFLAIECNELGQSPG